MAPSVLMTRDPLNGSRLSWSQLGPTLSTRSTDISSTRQILFVARTNFTPSDLCLSPLLHIGPHLIWTLIISFCKWGISLSNILIISSRCECGRPITNRLEGEAWDIKRWPVSPRYITDLISQCIMDSLVRGRGTLGRWIFLQGIPQTRKQRYWINILTFSLFPDRRWIQFDGF